LTLYRERFCEHRDSIPKARGLSRARQPRVGGGVVVIMPKRRPTIPIAHADDVPTIAFTDEQWQAIEQAYGRQLNADVRQQITIVTIQYLKDIDFDRTTAPKEMALKRIKRVRRPAGDLERVMFDREAFSAASDELSRQQQQSAHSYADGLIRRHLAEGALGWDKLHQFRDTLKSLIVACDCALNDLSAVEYRDDQPWDWWVQGLTRIAQEHHLPRGARIVEMSGEPSPFVALVRALQEHVPARHTSFEALPKAIRRAQRRARDK
jgi:hypothetical protein